MYLGAACVRPAAEHDRTIPRGRIYIRTLSGIGYIIIIRIHLPVVIIILYNICHYYGVL